MGSCLGLTTFDLNLDHPVELIRLLEAPIPGLVDGSKALSQASGVERGWRPSGNAQCGPGPQ